MFLAPKVGFDLFPASDNSLVTYGIEGAVGETTESFHARLEPLYDILSKYEEVKFFSVSTKDNAASVTVQLHKLHERKSAGLRSVFEIEEALNTALEPLRQGGLRIESKVLE